MTPASNQAQGAHTPGSTVYSQHGQEAEFVARSGGEYIVRPVYEDDDGPQCGGVETWPVVFRSPPAPRLDKDTAEAEQRLAALNAKVSELRAEHAALERGAAERLERIKRHEELAELDRYLAGEITHYVAVHDYYPTVEIIPISETVGHYKSNNGYGLLHLMPSRHWDKRIVWSVTYQTGNRGYDSTTRKVYPCCGEDDAKAKAEQVVRGIVAAYLAKEPRYRNYTDQLFKVCERFGVEVPQSLIDDDAAAKREAARQAITKHRDELAKAEEAFAAIAAATQGPKT